MELFHFNPPDFDPPDGRAREGRDNFTEDKSDADAKVELKKRFKAGRVAGRSAADASSSQGGGD